MKILVTGTAGFIGSFVAERLAERGDEVAKRRILSRRHIPEARENVTTEEFITQNYKNMSDEDLKGRVVGGDTQAAQILLQRTGATQQAQTPKVEGQIKVSPVDGNKYVWNQGKWVGPI